ncbi:MAG: hypothetical protein LBF79_06295, partial [Dysgonamonadaceae bacterium]|nr:hypothetical protein [Dysgonamonadaceae bacterium]
KKFIKKYLAVIKIISTFVPEKRYLNISRTVGLENSSNCIEIPRQASPRMAGCTPKGLPLSTADYKLGRGTQILL